MGEAKSVTKLQSLVRDRQINSSASADVSFLTLLTALLIHETRPHNQL
jgi:hypothetical protein